MLRLASITLSGLSTAWLLYWLQRSEWKYSPRSVFRIIRAFLSAVTTNSASKVSQELPSYHFSAEEIQDHSQVQPSFHRRNVSNIAGPDLVDSTGLQILYQIGHSALQSQKGDVVLVGYSYGGAVITGAGAASANVKALVYVSAFAPDRGEALEALIELYPPSSLPPALVPDSAGFLYIDRTKFREVFAADVSDSEFAVMAVTQKPIAAAAIF